MKKVLRCLLLTILALNIIGCGVHPKETISNISTPSFEIKESIDMKDYYIFSCDLCKFIKEQFDILVENYPERYSVLQSKLNEYSEELTTITSEDSDDDIFIKGNYALTYGEELIDLVKKKGLDSFVSNDYNELIDKGIIKDNE